MNNYGYGPLTRMRHLTDRWVHESTSEEDAHDRDGDRMESDSGQLDGTPTPGV